MHCTFPATVAHSRIRDSGLKSRRNASKKGRRASISADFGLRRQLLRGRRLPLPRALLRGAAAQRSDGLCGRGRQGHPQLPRGRDGVQRRPFEGHLDLETEALPLKKQLTLGTEERPIGLIRPVLGGEKALEPFEGFRAAQPMVYAGIYPEAVGDGERLETAMQRLLLTDASVEARRAFKGPFLVGFRVAFRVDFLSNSSDFKCSFGRCHVFGGVDVSRRSGTSRRCSVPASAVAF